MKVQAVKQVREAKYYAAARAAQQGMSDHLIQCDKIKDRTKNKRIAKKCGDQGARFEAIQPILQEACIGVDFTEPKVLRETALKLSRIVRSSGIRMKGLHGIQSNSLAYGYRG